MGLDGDLLFGLVNGYRKDNKLPLLKQDETTCRVAQLRAPQVYGEVFVTGNMHAGLASMKLPYWISENIIYYSTEQKAFQWWVNDAIHRTVMLGSYTNSCTSCFGYGCSQVFTSYIPK
jgi:uncharacterized protein YkwD